MTKAQYKALSIAIGVMDAYLSNGGADEDNEVSESLDIIIRMARQEERKRGKRK